MEFGPDFIMLLAIITLALVFDYINGFHDAANAIATVVATKVMTPRMAVFFGAVFNFAGALMSTEVAATIGKGIVDAHAITMPIVLCALVGGITWNLLTWWWGLPSSSSHALIGSLLGATFFGSGQGIQNIDWQVVMTKIITPMFSSPVVGFVVGFLIMTGLIWLVFRVHLHKINRLFGKLQILSAMFMALSHGNNDAQKSMGIIALALLTFSKMPGVHFPEWFFPSSGEFHVPLWVILSCASMIALGTLSGGWKIIHTLGNKMLKLQPIHGFAAETTASTIILVASHWGIPLSTTHVITSSIMGVGATKRLSAVKWGIVGNILWAWILTIPLTFLFSGMLMGIWNLFNR
ncbi:MAG: phosphate transporter [Vampirovibrio sp.]|jgi:PiT family inorganic phosphate transporter|nr:phosphate transporter [Vampirovibrio sp.]